MGRILIFCLFFFSVATAFAQESISLLQLKKELSSGSKVKVINFWATWCAPCVKEIPLFEKYRQEHDNIDMLLVSMDYDLDPNPDKVKMFVQRKKIQSRVLILTEANPTEWIDQIDKDWSGALPATLVINPQTAKRKLIEGEIKEGELEKIIETLK